MIYNVLNVAEKNDAAKSIAAILSSNNFKTRNSPSLYNKNYAFNYNFNQRDSNFIMTSVSGHLIDARFDGNYSNWGAVDPQLFFSLPITRAVSDQFLPISQNLCSLARKHSHLIIWTDCDREGENIGFEIIETVRSVNPSITVHRAIFSEITHASIIRAINNLQQPDRHKSNAVEARREFDLRVGVVFTRYLSTNLQRIFATTIGKNLVSYGPCQFPTLGFVVERYKERDSFVTEKSYSLGIEHRKLPASEDTDTSILNKFSWRRDKIFCQQVAQAIHKKLQQVNLAMVVNRLEKRVNKFRPMPFDTSNFERACVRLLKITAKEAMAIAEKLYTRGFISYPRTETNLFSKDIDLRTIVDRLYGESQNSDVSQFINRHLRDAITPRNGKNNDGAHPPIYPLKVPKSLTGNELKVYDLVLRNFLATCSKDAVGDELVIDIECGGEAFFTKGLIIKEYNYLEIYCFEKWKNRIIDDYQRGEQFKPSRITLNSGSTSPPNYLNEADLISLMCKYEIGTDATHAEHIDTVKKRGYVIPTKDVLVFLTS
ncbi:MAG: DNA topoisomerase 3-alpha, variant 2 [Marteilia pararefringens]